MSVPEQAAATTERRRCFISQMQIKLVYMVITCAVSCNVNDMLLVHNLLDNFVRWDIFFQLVWEHILVSNCCFQENRFGKSDFLNNAKSNLLDDEILD